MKKSPLSFLSVCEESEEIFLRRTQNVVEHRGKAIVLLTDEQARYIMKLRSGCRNATEFQRLSDFVINVATTGLGLGNYNFSEIVWG